MGIIRQMKHKKVCLQNRTIKKVLMIFLLFVGLTSCRQQVKPKDSTLETESIMSNSIIEPDTSNAGTVNRTSTSQVQVEIVSINKAQFDAAKLQEKVSRPIERITDFALVQKRLAGVVEFEKVDDNNLGITQIQFRNGTAMKDSGLLSECGFVAYFPTEDVLLLEGGHTTDVSFDLATGQGTYDTGNPDLMKTSASGKYRLNKVYEGQECFYHFLQEKKNGRFQKVAELNEIFEKKTKKWLCVIENEYWTDDNTLYFGLVTQFNETGNAYDYYKLVISEG